MTHQNLAQYQAFRIYGQITPDRKLLITLPDTVQEGPAEVIVFVQEPNQDIGKTSFDTFLAQLDQSPRRIKTREEIDRIIENARNSWD